MKSKKMFFFFCFSRLYLVFSSLCISYTNVNNTANFGLEKEKKKKKKKGNSKAKRETKKKKKDYARTCDSSDMKLPPKPYAPANHTNMYIHKYVCTHRHICSIQ